MVSLNKKRLYIIYYVLWCHYLIKDNKKIIYYLLRVMVSLNNKKYKKIIYYLLRVMGSLNNKK